MRGEPGRVMAAEVLLQDSGGVTSLERDLGAR